VSAARLEALVSGYVQGVGFRYWVQRQARTLELSGTARNLADGRVEVVVEGERAACETLLQVLRGDHTPGSVRDVSATWAAPQELTGFRTG
jgi:acylphosphatase